MSARPNYARFPGMGDLPGDSSNPNSPDYDNEAAERRDEAIDELVEEWNMDHAKRREAEEWTSGTFSGDHYTEVTLALDELHRCGARPDVLATLHRLAKVESDELQAKLRDMAEAEYDRAAAA